MGENSKSSCAIQIRLNHPDSCCFALWLTTQVKDLTRDLCKGHRGRVEAISGYGEFLPITFDWKEIQRRGWSLCVSLVETLQMICNMTYLGDLNLGLDLDPRSNFDLDLLRSKSIYSDAFRRGKHDGDIADSLPLLGQTLLMKNHPWKTLHVIHEKRYFFLWWPLEPRLLTLGQIWGETLPGH